MYMTFVQNFKNDASNKVKKCHFKIGIFFNKFLKQFNVIFDLTFIF